MGGFRSAPVSCRVPGTLAAWWLAARGLRGCRCPHAPDPRSCYSAALFRADKDAGVRSNRVKFKKKIKNRLSLCSKSMVLVNTGRTAVIPSLHTSFASTDMRVPPRRKQEC